MAAIIPFALMFGQTFQLVDITAILALAALEGLLSGDNALVLAIMVRHLPKIEQRRALSYGLAGAFIFRMIAIVFATVVLKQWWLQAIGAAYLLFLPIKHFVKATQPKGAVVKGGSFWQTVVAIQITDVAFAIDSVLAGVSFIGGKQDKVWIVFAGALIGIVMLRFAASLFVRLLEHYPILDHVAYLLVGWVGVKLAFHSAHAYTVAAQSTWDAPSMPEWLFWTGLGVIGIGGSYFAFKNRVEDTSLDATADLIDDCEPLQLPSDEPSQ